MSTNVDSAGAITLSHSRERPASTQNGFFMLLLLLVLFVAAVAAFGWLVATAKTGQTQTGRTQPSPKTQLPPQTQPAPTHTAVAPDSASSALRTAPAPGAAR